jgi:hypothetical protein
VRPAADQPFMQQWNLTVNIPVTWPSASTSPAVPCERPCPVLFLLLIAAALISGSIWWIVAGIVLLVLAKAVDA